MKTNNYIHSYQHLKYHKYSTKSVTKIYKLIRDRT